MIVWADIKTLICPHMPEDTFSYGPAQFMLIQIRLSYQPSHYCAFDIFQYNENMPIQIYWIFYH